MKTSHPCLVSRLRIALVRGSLALGTVSFLGYASLAQEPAEPKVESNAKSNVEVIRVTVDDEEANATAKTDSDKPKYWLGVILKGIEGDLATYLGEVEGVLVDRVFPDSPAAKAKLAKGDILIQLNGKKLDDPVAVMKTMNELPESSEEEAPKLDVLVLRQGKQIEIEVQLEQRPHEMAVGPAARLQYKLEGDAEVIDDEDMAEVEGAANAFSFSWTGENGEELQALLKKLGSGEFEKEMKLFRMGDPAMLFVPKQGAANFDSLQMIISRVIDGEEVKITISRKDGKPASIQVETDGETTEYSEADIQKLPESIRQIVEPALQQTGQGGISVEGSSVFQLGDGAVQLKVDADQARKMAEKYRAVAEKQAQSLRAKAEELAGKARRQAEEAMKEAEIAAAMSAEAVKSSSEVAELKKLVEQLKAEVLELRQQLKQKPE